MSLAPALAPIKQDSLLGKLMNGAFSKALGSSALRPSLSDGLKLTHNRFSDSIPAFISKDFEVPKPTQSATQNTEKAVENKK